MSLPTNAKEREEYPLITGVWDYFPLALQAIAYVSYKGNEQHNPGQPLHWDRSKSTDHLNKFGRHFMERGNVDTDGTLHTAKAVWRLLAYLQIECEQDEKAFREVEEEAYPRAAHVNIRFGGTD